MRQQKQGQSDVTREDLDWLLLALMTEVSDESRNVATSRRWKFKKTDFSPTEPLGNNAALSTP